MAYNRRRGSRLFASHSRVLRTRAASELTLNLLCLQAVFSAAAQLSASLGVEPLFLSLLPEPVLAQCGPQGLQPIVVRGG